MRKSHWAWLAAGIVMAALGATLAAQTGDTPADTRAAGAYGRLDQGILADSLSRMNMTELLDEMIRQNQSGASVQNLWVCAQGKIALATKEVENLDRRKKLFEEAQALLKQVVDASQKPATSQEKLARFRYLLTFVELSGRMMSQIHADELFMLMGGEEDRKTIDDYTATVLKPRVAPTGAKLRPLMDDLQDQVEEQLENWRSDSKDQVLYAPTLEQIKEEARYVSGWVKLFRGMSVDDRSERTRLLNEAIQAAEKYGLGQTDEGTKDPSALLLMGVASMQLGMTPTGAPGPLSATGDAEFKKAAEYFSQGLAVPETELPLQIQLRFQIVRNLIEWGKFEQAKQALEQFAPEAAKVSPIQADVYVALLKNHLYAQWALVSGADKAKVDEYQLAAQNALLEFMTKHQKDDVIKKAFFSVIANKYRDAKDYEKLSPIIQLAIGINEFGIKTPESLARAKKALELVLASRDPSAASLQDLANSYLGQVIVASGGGASAAEAFLKAGTMEGTLNACIVYKNEIERGRVTNIVDVRKKFIEAIKVLLGKPEWAAKPEAAIWHVDLGEQYQELARRQTPDQEMVDFLSKAIDAYNKVPTANQKMSVEARHVSLNLEYQMLDAMKQLNASKDQIDSRAKTLVDGLEQFAKQCEELTAKVSEKDYQQNLREWAADGIFTAAMVRYEHLGQEDQALAVIRQLPQKWPNTRVLLVAKEYEIRKLIERQQTDAAVAQINQLKAQRPEQAQDLMQLVINQLRARISQLRNDPAQSAQLDKTRKTYIDFATQLLEKNKDAAPQAQYSFKQMYADALLENGKAQEALTLFEALNGVEKTRRAEKEKIVDTEVDAMVVQMNKVKDSRAGIEKLAEDFPAQVQKEGIDPERKGYARALKVSLNYFKQANQADATDVAFRTKQLEEKLKEAYSDLRKDLKNTIPTDSVNIYGLARSYRLMKKYNESIANYQLLTNGIDAVRYRLQHWQAQLEYCQCLLEGFKADKKSMRNLTLLIRDYRQKDAELGGLAKEFEKLEAQAAAAAN